MADGFVPPQEVRSAARRGLELRDKFGRGGTEVGIARARDLSNGRSVSYDTIKRMNSFFSRHEVDKKGKDWDNAERPSNGKIAWLLWGGDAGWAWAKRIIREQESKEKSMTQDVAHSYASIVKYDKNDDGTLLVYGKATDDSLDIDQQICDATWLDRAMPQWFKSGGNIREQHSNIAAGVAQEYEQKEDGHYITALVVDPVSVKKVENRVLKGFSIGIKAPRVVRDTKAVNGRIVDGEIVEVSLVDRPANPNAKLMLAKSVDGELAQVEEFVEKREVSTEERERLAEEGEAMPDGSYPIANVSDLKNAIQAFGRAKDKEAVKRHIIRRARDLDAVDQLPEGWNVKKSVQEFITKFDKSSFEAARDALARLIEVEAGELTMGHDERMSLHHLMEAVSHLMAWYDGEKWEGEVEGMVEEADIERAADMDTAGCDCDGCKMCKEDGGCDNKMCDGHKKMMEKTAEHKCLECGCHQPANSHGRDDVTTAEMVQEKSAEGEEVTEAGEEAETVTEQADESAEETSDGVASDSIEEIVAKAVAAATEAVRTEVASLKSATEAAEQKAAGLETQLGDALNKAASGGPKRTARTSEKSLSDFITKAAVYRAKAAAATDPLLAKGYRSLAEEFEAKAFPTPESTSN